MTAPWRIVAVAAGLAAGLALTGCSADEPVSAPVPRPSASPATAAPPPPPPKVGSCHALTFEEATEPVDTAEPVPCTGPHTSVTVAVERLDRVVDGHLLAIDSRTVRARIAEACPPDAGGFLGGDPTTRRLSRFEVVAFSPSLEQADAGASWVRCDVVALEESGRLRELPARLEGILDRDGALDEFGTCGTRAPGRRGFERLACSQDHAWRAVDAVDLPRGTRYLGKGAAAEGDAACKAVAAARSGGSLSYSWGFEWPTRAEWDDGQRYGYCWVPD